MRRGLADATRLLFASKRLAHRGMADNGAAQNGRMEKFIRAGSQLKTAPARWCALHFLARMAQQVHSRAGKT